MKIFIHFCFQGSWNWGARVANFILAVGPEFVYYLDLLTNLRELWVKKYSSLDIFKHTNLIRCFPNRPDMWDFIKVKNWTSTAEGIWGWATLSGYLWFSFLIRRRHGILDWILIQNSKYEPHWVCTKWTTLQRLFNGKTVQGLDERKRGLGSLFFTTSLLFVRVDGKGKRIKLFIFSWGFQGTLRKVIHLRNPFLSPSSSTWTNTIG